MNTNQDRFFLNKWVLDGIVNGVGISTLLGE
jgi:hypothetical protein